MVSKKIKNYIVNIYNDYKDFISRYYLKKICKKKHNIEKTMNVGFIVFEPETWDKQEPVFNELKKRKNVKVDLLIVPSFDQELKLTTKYGKELSFFKQIDSNAIVTCDDNGCFIDISKFNYDYIFYQDPYNGHMPKKLRSDYVIKFSKICYIPYGFSGSDAFSAGNTNKEFFRNVYFSFTDVIEVNEILKRKYKKNLEEGIQHIEHLGYPAMEEYFEIKSDGIISNIIWTPRWSYAPKIGGSHFIEYKNNYPKLKQKYPLLNFTIRPHPMMFANFIKEGLISNKDKEEYLRYLKSNHVELSIGNDLKNDFLNADLLITDFSSIIPMFFLTGKPIIYCPSDIILNQEYSRIAEGMYIANDWLEIEKYVNEIVNGNDFLKTKRKEIINELFNEHSGSTNRIVDCIIEDYTKSTL